jgi:hypothetical protein
VESEKQKAKMTKASGFPSQAIPHRRVNGTPSWSVSSLNDPSLMLRSAVQQQQQHPQVLRNRLLALLEEAINIIEEEEEGEESCMPGENNDQCIKYRSSPSRRA